MALKTVVRYREPYEAHIARSRLESEGIPAFVVDEHYVGVNWLMSHAINGVKLQVVEDDLVRAEEILFQPAEAIEPGLVPDPIEQADLEIDRCPVCHGNQIRSTLLDRRVRVLGLWSGIPLAAGQYRLRCDGCGHHWRDRPAHRQFVLRIADLFALVWMAVAGVAGTLWRSLKGFVGR